ncbi:MAG: Gfo/Idh/MocA family protein [bacterium]
MKRLKLAGIGCGGRTITYMNLASQMPEYYEVVAAADPRGNRVERARQASRNPEFRGFTCDSEILAHPKLADIMIIGTQDDYHVEPCIAAMEKGYDILLEKPIAQNIDAVIDLEARAHELKRRVLVCHVLRYAPFYRKVKDLIDSGAIGDVITMNAIEGVGAWHQCHSFVRGHWAVVEESNPMLIAKSCHDMDILYWMAGARCRRVSSYGHQSWFNSEHCPKGAPKYCVEGCPIGMECPYNAMLYATRHRGWLRHVYDHEDGASLEQIREWLSHSKWGRCVYQCDNTTVDHQIVSCDFENGVTATFTMTAFDNGRNIEIQGSKGRLRAGDFVKRRTGHEIIVEEHDGGNTTHYDVSSMVGGYSGHGGGDPGLVVGLYDEMTKREPEEMLSALKVSVESHLMGFAAEESRLQKKTVSLADYYSEHGGARR